MRTFWQKSGLFSNFFSCHGVEPFLKMNHKGDNMAKKAAKKKYSFINELYEGVMGITEVSKNGAVKIKRSELKELVETTFTKGAKLAAGGERIRFPVIGALVRREVKARKAGKGTNPFTGETIDVKARPASKKPRWSFPKTLKDTFADKKNW
jgi:nucleoid DNA-binding protein